MFFFIVVCIWSSGNWNHETKTKYQLSRIRASLNAAAKFKDGSDTEKVLTMRRKEVDNLQYIFWPYFKRNLESPLEKERLVVSKKLVKVLEAIQSKNDEKEFSKV